MSGSEDPKRWLRGWNGAKVTCLAAAALCVALALVMQTSRAAEDTPQSLLAHGEYQKAIGSAEALLSRAPDRADAMAALLNAMIATGDYRKAAERGEEFLKRKADSVVAFETAQAWSLVGEYDRAEARLTPFATAEALWMRGTLAKRKGDRLSARTLFGQAAALLGRATAGSSSPSAPELAAIADSMSELGQYKEANQVYQSADKLFPDDAVLKTRWGNLMASKHNPGDAEGLYREALKANEKQTAALIGLAELAAGNWDNKASVLVKQALDVDPNLAEAKLLLAQVQLEQENYAEAAKQLDAIDSVNPKLLEAWSLRAVSESLQGHNAALDQQWIPKILTENSAYGELFAALGDFAVIKRQYGPAVDYYRRALATNPELDDTRSNLGINVFRLGEEEEARKILEEAYNRDPYNIWTVNTLRLMDSLAGYQTFETDKFRVRLNKKEAALLWPYVNDLLEEGYASLTKRYGYTPPQKVLIEVFPDHEDFAVRTLGLPGLGALGASFGPVVAMDSPSARPTGDFHWGSTLWHEFGHVITLGMTANKVPRWFTEGLSVYEESHAHPGWGDPLNVGILQALQKYGLVPIEKFDGVFVRPQYPTQVVVAYFQAGMICDFVVDTYGFPKIVAMLKAYADGKNDAGAIHDALGLSLEEFDKAFTEYARVKTYNFGEAVHFDTVHVGGLDQADDEEHGEAEPSRVITPEMASSFDRSKDFLALLRGAAEFRKQSKFPEAIADAEQAKKLFPLYTEEGNPYELLAGIYEEQSQKEKAVAELDAWRLQRGRDPKSFKKLAELQAELGRRKDAIQTLTDALQVSMYDAEIHDRLGTLQMEDGNTKLAVREYLAVLALNPADKAEAHYRLATAYWKQLDRTNAKSEILAALEIAPGYRPAQQLLLEMNKQ